MIAENWRATFAQSYPYLRNALAAGYFKSEVQLHELLFAAICAGDDAFAAKTMRNLFPAGGPYEPMAAAKAEPLEEWCARNAAPFQTVSSARPITIPATSAYTQGYAYDCDRSVFASLQDAVWIPGWDFVIANGDTVISDSGYMPLTAQYAVHGHSYLPDHNVVAFCRPDSEVVVEDETLFLSEPNQGHFGHWMVDFLPRLRGRDIAGKPLKIAVPDTLTAKQVETLRSFGVTESDLILCSRRHRYRFRTLHLYHPGRYSPPIPENVDYIRKHLSRHNAAFTPGKRIYAGRTSVGTRLIRNDAEFKKLLSEEGFVAVDMADLTIAQQQALLCDAEIILGAFGTNLFSLYFAPAGCTVIALIDDISTDPVIPHTCAIFGMKHQYLTCAVAGKSVGVPTKQPLKKDNDFYVDCGELRRRLKELS